MDIFILTFVSIILLGFIFATISIYNGLISLKNQIERAWSNIDVVLKQRFDEIPQIIQVVEQYAGYESALLKNLAEARAHYGNAQNIGDKIKATHEMSFALKGIFAIGEAYPELKANQNFSQLQQRISQLENTIADRRETYNDASTNFNTRIEQLPDVFIARFLNYKKYDLFKALDSEKQKPNLKMNLPKSA